VIGRTVAADYGRKRVGLAACDPLGITVRGLDTVSLPEGSSPASAAEAVARALADEDVARFVVGLPVRADGSDSDLTREARAFGEALAQATRRPVEYHDEGLTSWAAEEDAKAAGKRLRRARERGEVDRAAAVAILRSWLAERGAGGSPPPAG
jgi:putative Holliday junction resolvase